MDKITAILKKESSFTRAFFMALSQLDVFSAEVPVYFARTNAEKNVYQAQFLSAMEEVKDRFVLEYLPEHEDGFFDPSTFMVKTHFGYIKNFYFGDKMNVSLRVKEWFSDDGSVFDEGFILEAKFTSEQGLHTVGKQWILFDQINPEKVYYDYTRSGDFPYSLLVTRPLVNHKCCLSIDKIAELFGNAREEMALTLIPKFLGDIRAENYGMVTRKATYEYYRPVFRGQKLYVQMRIFRMGMTNASFILQADYTTTDSKGEDIVNVRAEQEIVYINKEGKREDLPPELLGLVRFSIDQAC
jgi:acyl-CoA thioesterase FadM